MNTKYTAANADVRNILLLLIIGFQRMTRQKSESDSIANQRKSLFLPMWIHIQISSWLREHYDDGYFRNEL